MNFNFKIEYVDHGEGGYLYSFTIEDKANTEFEEFTNNQKNQNSTDFKPLLERLDQMVENQQFREHFFKRESKLMDDVVALHYDNKKLRLFCIRLGQNLLIAGNGGIKNTKTTQQDSFLDNIVKQISYVSDIIGKSLEEKDHKIGLTGKLLGNFNFKNE